MRKIVGSLLLLVLIVSLGFAGYGYRTYQSLTEPASFTSDQVFEIDKGEALRQVARRLEQLELIGDARAWYWFARYKALDRRVKAGEYEIPAGANALEMLDIFVSGKARLHTVTLLEGWTTKQALRAIQDHPAIVATLTPGDTSAILAAMGASESHPEGLLFPSTYHFSKGTEDRELLSQAYALLQTELNQAWESRVPELPFSTPYEALILASIVEKETGRDDEREAIAGVFVRRLKKRMRLETDPTVIYGIGEAYDGNIRRRDLRTDTPYNTYTRSGLTPTPIALAGRGSLQAAVNPADGDALYFVATGEGDGRHYFSKSYEEHQQAVARYLARMREQRQ